MKKLFLSVFIFTMLFAFKLKAQQAELQIIHNSADAALMLIDVYVNDTLVADDIIFRSATPMITLPADSLLNIGIALNSSSSVADTVKSFQLTMQDSGRYIALINGVFDSAQYAPNPNGASTALTILFQNNIAAAAGNPSNVDFIIAQGATDLGISDFVIRNDKKIADDIIYNTATAYDSVAATSFTLDITASTNDTIITSYQVDFTGMDGSSAVLVASGFRDPAANQNGPSFEFFAAFPNGSVIEFFPTSLGKLQAIHNCADPALDSIDIYTNGVVVVDNFHFRTATNLFDVPAGVPFTVSIAPGNSTSINDTIKSFTLTFENGKNYVLLATGVIDTAAFAPNPDGTDNSFTVLLQDGMRWKAQNTNDVDFRFVNGVTDAPTVDLKFSGGPVLIDNTPYGSMTPYNSLAAAGTYNIDVTDSGNAVTYNAYQVNGSSFIGQSVVVFFSGFLNPANNQNGALYSLFAAFPNGFVTELPVVTGTNELTTNTELNLYPNPANDLLNIKLNGIVKGKSTLKMFSVDGKLIFQKQFEGNATQVDLKNIVRGIYFVEVSNDRLIYRGKVVVEQ